MRSDPPPRIHVLRRPPAPRRFALGLVLVAVAGCGGTKPTPAGDPRAALPPALVASLPHDLEVCFDEASDVPRSYRLWLVRAPGASWLKPPAELGPAHVHDLPQRFLRGMFETKVPDVEFGTAQQPRGRFTHWRLGETEIQVREVITGNGWFASLETFEPDVAAEAGERSPTR